MKCEIFYVIIDTLITYLSKRKIVNTEFDKNFGFLLKLENLDITIMRENTIFTTC